MPVPNLKQDVRPISFLLHNLATGAAPVEVNLRIRPEDLSRASQSRLMVHQTFGGAWADNFGEGVPTVQISGTTGWGQGNLSNGLDDFLRLHDTVFKRWHKERDDALKAGRDPDLVKLIFSDMLDDFTWVVAPQNFVLRRNKSRPLLAQYQINMTRLSESVSLPAGTPNLSQAARESLGFESLDDSFYKFKAFTDDLNKGILSFAAELNSPVKAMVDLTTKVNNEAYRWMKESAGVIDTVGGSLLTIGVNLNRAASNVMWLTQTVTTMPDVVKAKFMRVASAYTNAACVFENIFKRRAFVPNYMSIYGSSTCSSTSGYNPPSPFSKGLNTFEFIKPSSSPKTVVSQQASNAITFIGSAVDVSRSGMSVVDLKDNINAITNGVSLP